MDSPLICTRSIGSYPRHFLYLSPRPVPEDCVTTMKVNLAPSVSVDFLDGYLFRLLQEIVADRGSEKSGFFDYYTARVTGKLGGLMEYEERLARYLLANFSGRHIVHAGTGIGTLPCVLACNGMTVTAIEGLHSRVESARRIRKALVDIWPEADSRYEIIAGVYPEALASRPYGPDAVLVFTNVASAWTLEQEGSIIHSMQGFGDAVLDLRLFGHVRDEEGERAELFARIASTARRAGRLPDIGARLDAHYARFGFLSTPRGHARAVDEARQGQSPSAPHAQGDSRGGRRVGDHPRS